ncbi:MAG: response regulator [Bradymonadales bacterium]|nr:response regulator [Bradymonadales bacterium]
MTRAAPTGRSDKARILVIDDEAIVCLACTRILTLEGHQVDSYQDPVKGLQAALDGSYDVVLLDIIMPDLDGMEILKQIREAAIPAEVVIMTGYSTVQTAIEAMKLGAVDYVSKPFTPEELTVVVTKAIDRYRLLRECAVLRQQLRINRQPGESEEAGQAMQRLETFIRQSVPLTWEQLVETKKRACELATDLLEHRFLVEALRRNQQDVNRAAAEAGMEPTEFADLIRKHRLDVEEE